MAASLLKIDVEGVRANVVHSAVGAINESDITLRKLQMPLSSDLTFVLHHKHVKRKLMKLENSQVFTRIIYKVTEEIEDYERDA